MMDYKSQGNVAFGQKEWTKAAELYTKALEQDPRMVAALANRAACWIKLGRWADGHSDCKNGLKYAEKEQKLVPKLLWRMAICERELGLDNSETIAKGLEVAPENPELLHELEMARTTIPIKDVDVLPPQFQSRQPDMPQPSKPVEPVEPAKPVKPSITRSTKIPSFVPPHRPLTYSGVAEATRVANAEAYDWWYTLDPEELTRAHRNAGLEPNTLDYVNKMVGVRGGSQGIALLNALSKCPRYESAKLMADESLAKQAELAIK